MNEEKNVENKQIEVSVIKNASFNLLEVVAIIIITALIVGVGAGIIVYKNYDSIDSSVVGNNTNSEHLNELVKAYKNILNSYVDNVDEEGLVDKAIEAMYDYLGDPYTDYLDEETSADLQDRLKGEYKGIGVEITSTVEGNPTIVNVFADTPASKAGVKAGDQVLKINGEDVSNKTASEVSSMIKNSNHTNITMEVLRNEKNVTLTITLDNVVIPVVTSENFDGVGYLSLETFSATSYTQFKNKLEELESDGIKSLIIDVRGNTGGYLTMATKMADMFLEKGKIIYNLEYKDGTKESSKATSNSKRNYEIIVLINSSTASASEILAAALRESYGAKLVGTKSYGKGSIQETQNLSSGSMTKITTAHWLTPKWNKVEGIGLYADLNVEFESYEGEYTYLKDNQLQKAISELKK